MKSERKRKIGERFQLKLDKGEEKRFEEIISGGDPLLPHDREQCNILIGEILKGKANVSWNQ